jgi:hypothetical protein
MPLIKSIQLDPDVPEIRNKEISKVYSIYSTVNVTAADGPSSSWRRVTGLTLIRCARTRQKWFDIRE